MSPKTSRNTRGRQMTVEPLEGRRLLSGVIVQGSGPGRAPEIRVFDSDSGVEKLRFAPFGPRMTGGVRVGMGDIDGDGSLDIVAVPGPATARAVAKVFRSTDGSLIGQFPLPKSWALAGVSVAVGDVTADGHADIVVAPSRGVPQIQVYEGVGGQLSQSYRADAGLKNPLWRGTNLAVGDVDRDGHADVVATPVFGKSTVAVFSGDDGALLSRFQSFAGRSGGRNSLALADVDGNRSLEVVAAAPQGHDAVLKAFAATSGQVLGRIAITGAAAPSGVRIASINLEGRNADELAITAARGGAGAVVLASSAWDLKAATLTAPPIAYRLPTSTGGGFFAGDNSVAVTTPAVAVGMIEPPLSQNLPVLDRLAYLGPDGKFVPTQANDPRLVGKNITVIVHGWAPGYIDWVNHEANDNNHVLKWWETFPGQPGYDSAWNDVQKVAPDSPFLLDGITAAGYFSDTTVSTTGLAQTIASRATSTPTGPIDPNAVVLAYSWIDDSATPDWDVVVSKIPHEAYKSEALTTLNGERLASALEQALGSSFTGNIQLVGHSHGSKVVSVASAAIQAAGLPLKQVTILDSPESDSTVVGDAANYNWFFLQDLQGVDRSKAQDPFIENVISEFGISYSGITLSNGGGANLDQIVDVDLSPDVYSEVNLGDRHAYAAGWYTGSGETAVTYGQTVGQYWSPLLPANAGQSNPVPGLPSYAEQNWNFIFQTTSQQYVLNPQSGPPTETIKFDTLTNPPVTVTQDGTMASSAPMQVSAGLFGLSGIAFDYQFPTAQPGDRLIILADGKPAFVMDAALVGSAVAHATMSLYFLPFESHSLTFVLTSTTSNTTSQVTISNFRTFAQPLTGV